MKTLRFLLRSVGSLALALALLGLASAACNGALLATIHRALGDRSVESAARAVMLAFFGFGAGRVLAAYLSTVLLGNHATRTVEAMRNEIVTRLLHVPYRKLEHVGSARVLSALTQDVAMIEAGLSSVPSAITSAATLVGGAAYLLYLSARLFALLSLVVVFCLLVFRRAARFAQVSQGLQRKAYDRLWSLYGSLTQGTKELKQHAPRRTSFVNGPLRETAAELSRHDVAMRNRYALSGAVNTTLILFVLSLVLFALPHDSALRSEVASGYVLVGLYLISPLASLARMWPMFRAVEIALQALEDLGVRLASGDDDEASAGESEQPSVSRIELSAVRFSYDDERHFTLGPVSFSLSPGQIVFVVGGNGSGKTTLARLLSGLYAPSEGELRWDGNPVTPRELDRYRQLWSVVFSDLHLFDRLYGIGAGRIDERAAALIERLELSRIVRVSDGTFSTLDVSQGQRKRLGLLVALLEDRPMYLFDEWAADQDPDWKRVFYRELLPELRARGKGVVVITHDDRYFDAADRVLVLRDGALDAN